MWMMLARLLLMIACAACTGCGDDDSAAPPPPPPGPTATGGTSPSTSPVGEADSGARATGGVFEAPATQPGQR